MDLNVAAIVRSEDVSAALNRVCNDLDGTKVEVQIGRLKNLGSVVLPDSDVLIVDVDTNDEDDIAELARLMTRQFAGRPVVATAAGVSIKDIQRLIRLGVIDFLPQPISSADVTAALEHVVRRQAQSAAESGSTGGQIVAFLKGAGGVGATTLAVQMGCALATDRKAAKPEFCVVDFDIQFGTAALYLDLLPPIDYGDLVSAPERLDGELLRGLMGHHGSGLDVLGVPADVMPLDTLTPEFVSAFLDVARREYSLTLLDLPIAWSGSTYVALQAADLIVVVTNLSVTAVRQSRRQLDTLQAHGLPADRIKVVLNRFNKGGSGTVQAKEAQQALGHAFDYVIVDDPKVVGEATNQGVFLSAIKKRSKVERSVRRMMDRVKADLESVKALEE